MILGRLRGRESESDEEVPFYEREFNQIKAQIRLEQENPQLGIVAIIKRPSYRKRLFIILFFFAFQQLTAIIPLQNYQTILYTDLGLTGKIPLVLVGVWGTLGVIFSCAGAFFFDKIGRRKSFFISMSGVCLGSTMLVIFWARYENSGSTNKTLGSLALWSMFMYLVGYAWILNSFGYAYTPEILVSSSVGIYLSLVRTATNLLLADGDSSNRSCVWLRHAEWNNNHAGASYTTGDRGNLLAILPYFYFYGCFLCGGSIFHIPGNRECTIRRSGCVIWR
jgi:hypothetical protein